MKTLHDGGQLPHVSVIEGGLCQDDKTHIRPACRHGYMVRDLPKKKIFACMATFYTNHLVRDVGGRDRLTVGEYRPRACPAPARSTHVLCYLQCSRPDRPRHLRIIIT